MCIGAAAQINCVTSSKLVCLIPFTTNVFLPGSTSSATATAVGFNGPIGAQLSQLPLAVSAPGAVILVDRGNPVSYDNLGPILIDRPDPVRQGRLVFGFSFQAFNFNSINGISLGSVPFAYTASSTNSNTVSYVSQTEHISFKYNQYVVLATYGLPEKTDVSVVVPFARVSIGAGTLPGGQGYVLNSNNVVTNTYDLGTTYVPGSAAGIGDIQFNVKHLLWNGGESGRGALAVGGVFRVPSGDAQNYLGSGAYGFNLYALASYKARISPHVKIANEWNGPTVLLNPSGVGDRRLPGGIQYDVGADGKIVRSVTASVDLLGSEFINAPSFSNSSVTIPFSSGPLPPNTTTYSLKTVALVSNSYTIANFSAGLKWKPLKRKGLILYGNVLVQLNNVGLRTDPVPSGGISYSFDTIK